MAKCKGLAYCHFFFGVIYASGTMLLDPETAGPIIFLVIFPFAMTMTLFYVWTLHAIKTTLAVLTLKKQTVKAAMYRRLWWLLLWSITMVIVLFAVDFILFWRRDTEGWGAQHWHSKWFLLDGWNNVLYFITFVVIAFLWRPTSNNRRFGLDQLAQDEDEAVDLEEGLDTARRQGLTKMMRKGGIEEGMEEGIFDLGDESDAEEDEYSKAKRASADEGEVEGGKLKSRGERARVA
jgi:Lung seven transmembrane receptor